MSVDRTVERGRPGPGRRERWRRALQGPQARWVQRTWLTPVFLLAVMLSVIVSSWQRRGAALAVLGVLAVGAALAEPVAGQWPHTRAGGWVRARSRFLRLVTVITLVPWWTGRWSLSTAQWLGVSLGYLALVAVALVLTGRRPS